MIYIARTLWSCYWSLIQLGYYMLLVVAQCVFRPTGSGIGWCLLRFNLYNLGREIRYGFGIVWRVRRSPPMWLHQLIKEFESLRANISASRVSLVVSCDPQGSILEFGPLWVRAQKAAGLIWKKNTTWSWKEKFNLRLKASSYKLQAASDTTCGCVDKFNKDLTCRIMHDTV